MGLAGYNSDGIDHLESVLSTNRFDSGFPNLGRCDAFKVYERETRTRNTDSRDPLMPPRPPPPPAYTASTPNTTTTDPRLVWSVGYARLALIKADPADVQRLKLLASPELLMMSLSPDDDLHWLF